MLHTLTLEQLTELREQITCMINLKSDNTVDHHPHDSTHTRLIRSTGLTHHLSVGAPCTVDHHKVVGMTGKIVKVNRTRCKVEFDGNRYTVPMSMISLA